MNPLRATAALALVALLAGSRAAAASLARAPVAGETVRLTLATPPPVEGTLLASRVDALELALAPDSTRRTIPRTEVAGLEVRRKHGSGLRGALIGSVGLGLASAGAASALLGRAGEEGFSSEVFFVGAAVGGVLGFMIGDGIYRRTWDAAELP
jgi:hypothetical protein